MVVNKACGSSLIEVFPKGGARITIEDFMITAYQSIQWLHNLLKGEG